MSAPSTDLPLSSVSSSGHVDGLGRRLLAFDRETGAMMERLHLRPELSAFETALRNRVETLVQFEDEHFARPFSIQRDTQTNELTVLAEFVAGSRLSELLETAQEEGIVPGVDVALGFLLEALSALATFHRTAGFAHGLIDPARTVITSSGQVVFLDCSFGAVVERLALSRQRLWTELGIAAPTSSGLVAFDMTGDVAQVALAAVMLVLGRRLRNQDIPHGLPSLLVEVVDVAQIRGSNLFASGFKRFFQRALPLPGRRPFSKTEEALDEVRQLLRREIGMAACRQALIDFTDQMDAALAPASEDDEVGAVERAAYSLASETGFSLGSFPLDAIDSLEVLTDEDEDRDLPALDADDEAEDDESVEVELSLDDEASVSTPPPAPAADWAMRAPFPELDEEPVVPILLHEFAPVEDVSPRRFEAPPASLVESPPATDIQPETAVDMERVNGPTYVEPAMDPAPAAQAAALTVAGDQAESLAAEDPVDASHGSSRRRKRQQKSARARKDKLRSTTAPPASPPPQKPEAPKPAQSGWLVSPDRAAKFDAPVPAPAAPVAAPPPPPTPASPPPVAVQAPAVVAVPAQPIPMPVFGAPRVPATAPAVAPMPAAATPAQPALPPIAIAQKSAPSGAPLRLKPDPPRPYAPPRTPDPVVASPYAQRGPMLQVVEPRPFPWKLAAVALLIVAAAVVVGRAYLASKQKAREDKPAVSELAPPEPKTVTATPPAATTGEIVIETQPAGAKVLLDGKAVGESPLKLTGIPSRRHVVTFISSSGEISRTVRVAANKTVTLDVPIFSGWVAIFAPIALEVSENGRSLGTTEQNRIMLAPGRHDLTLTNRDLGYIGTQAVDIEPGELRSVTIEPRGTVNFNAVPWAEVWAEGKKLGDTPLANMRVPLGVREFVFKHPQHGERRVTAIVRADRATPVSVDYSR